MPEETIFSCAKSYVDHNLSRILCYKHHLSLFQEMWRGCCLAFVQQSCSSVLCCIGLFSEGLSSQLSRFNLKMCILKVWNVLNLNACRIGVCFIVNYGCLCSLIVCVFYFVTLSISKSILISYIFIDEKQRATFSPDLKKEYICMCVYVCMCTYVYIYIYNFL